MHLDPHVLELHWKYKVITFRKIILLRDRERERVCARTHICTHACRETSYHNCCQQKHKYSWTQNIRHHGRPGQQLFIQNHVLISKHVFISILELCMQLVRIYLSKVSTDCWFFESSSVGLVGSSADFGGMGRGEGTSHFHLISALQFYLFVYIRRDRLWVGESIVTSCGELGGAGRLQWRANSFAINVLSSSERWRLATPIVESKRKHGIICQ